MSIEVEEEPRRKRRLRRREPQAAPAAPVTASPKRTKEERRARRRRRWRTIRKWFARLFALVALGGAGTAIYFAINSVEHKHPVTSAQAREAMNQLTVANRNLSRELGVLKLHVSPQLAIEANRSAAATGRRLQKDVREEGDLGLAVHKALKNELSYLDAVGSTLINPASKLQTKVGIRQTRLRESLRNIPGGAPRAISGGQNLLAYSRARVAAKASGG